MPTISVRRLDYETLRTRLKADNRIVILSCNACAKQSDGLGGEEGLNGLADRLVADGFEVIHRELLPVACSPDQLRPRLQAGAVRELFDQADLLIPLSCQAGVDRAAEVLPDLTVLQLTETLGKGTYSPEKGARLTEPRDGIDIAINDPEGLSIPDAAKQLGLYPGSFGEDPEDADHGETE